MANISPILLNKINSKNNTPSNKAHHEKVYEDLTQHANDVKPNEPKAKLIKENPIQATISYFKDLKQDTVNFVTAVKTGKMNDNSLGRLNDLGLKAGALIIASYLAAHSKSKTDAAMRFIGGGAFIGAMSLWPKLFLNLPAKLVHGFDIGQRYISAQGDKKDFFLDNQFLPWDAYSTEELAKIGKRNGIDINSKNGKEKIERKMQKVALQNRTLWMATAGFSTPLMTALFCDKIEPHVKNLIINSQFEKAKHILSEIDAAGASDAAKDSKLTQPFRKFFKRITDGYTFKERMDKIDNEAKQASASGIETVVDNFLKDKAPTDKGFFEELASLMNITDMGLSEYDTKVLKPYTIPTDAVKTALENLYDKNAIIKTDKEKVFELLKEAYESASSTAKQSTSFGNEAFALGTEEIKELAEQIAGGSIDNCKSLLICSSQKRRLDPEVVDHLIKEFNIDSGGFRTVVSKFYRETFLPSRAKLKTYLSTLNATIGNVPESKSTQQITGCVSNMLKKLNLSDEQLRDFSKIITVMENAEDGQSVKENSEAIEAGFGYLREYFQKAVKDKEFGSKEYRELINSLITPNKTTPFSDKSTADSLFASLGKCIGKIIPNVESDSQTKELFDAITKNNEGEVSIYGILRQFLEEQKLNIDAFTTRAAICANFEARLQSKDGIFIEGIGNLNAKENKKFLDLARTLIYKGDPAAIKTKLNFNEIFAGNQHMFETFTNTILSDEAFKDEPDIVKEAVKALQVTGFDGNNRGAIQNGKPTAEYLTNLNFVNQIKNGATNLLNNKCWKKYFVPMALALVAVTLLAQPFFGNIKKEYPEEKQNGGKN